MTTRDSFDEVLRRHAETTGRKPWLHGRDTGAPEGERLEFAYLDLRPEIGLMVEVYPRHMEEELMKVIGRMEP